ncbi:O-antigen ligase family protein [Melioribacteraceae bacterium 4301-Me]|uniref:O-antigen ligase family protein n=1 Tax=Pyranulibacter aquaticus TaxID=3163344 RepID=UPI00359C07A7
MIEPNSKLITAIDKLIYFFSIVFLCTLTNSIFLNQIGYYSALILIIVRFYLTGSNPFRKTGLEYAFLFYIAAEILSTVFSVNPSQSFHNLLKRVFLIPIIYTFIISASDFERAKKYVVIYLSAAIATMLIYIGASYKYFINSFYQLYESGPSTFQYPITSSELMSFSLIILFAFLINEKLNIKLRALTLIAFVINLLALAATYKRTGWLGAAAGILLVILLSRKWILLLPVILLVAVSFFIEKNVSKITIYDYKQNNLHFIEELKTDGRAYSIFPSDSIYYVSDFENGLLEFNASNNKIMNKYNFESPVIKFQKWQDNFYVANLIDTRFVLMNVNHSKKFNKITEFLTPGFLTDWCKANKFLYAIDSDSGLTIFRDPLNLRNKLRYTDKAITNNNVKIFADSSFLVLFSKTKILSVYSLKNFLPEKILDTKKFSPKSDLVFYKDSKIIVSDENGLNLYLIEPNNIELMNTEKNIRNAYLATSSNEKIFIATTKKYLAQVEISDSLKFLHSSISYLGFVPTSIISQDSLLYFTQVKRSRLLSIFDPYLPSNFSRLALWRAGLLIFRDHPLFGVGDIDLANLYKQYKRDFDKEIQGHMHNNYIHLLVTLGLFGFIAVMFLLVKIFVIHIKNYFTLKDIPFASSYALGASGAFLAFLVSGLTEWNFGDHEIITMVWFLLAIGKSLSQTLP